MVGNHLPLLQNESILCSEQLQDNPVRPSINLVSLNPERMWDLLVHSDFQNIKSPALVKRIILATHTNFLTSSKDLLLLILLRIIGLNGEPKQEKAIEALDMWTNQQPEDFEQPMKECLFLFIKVHPVPRVVDIINRILQRKKAYSPPILSIPPIELELSSKDLISFTPQFLAEQLTLIFSSYFLQVKVQTNQKKKNSFGKFFFWFIYFLFSLFGKVN
jgi:hypothetical protein